MGNYNYKKGLAAMLCSFLIWGFQPLYWHLCREFDTFFLLAARTLWAAAFCLLLLKVQGKLDQLKAAFLDKNILKREIPAMLLMLGDWAIYLWAVQNGRVLECSLGYYIQPLVVFTFGAVIFKEKLSWRHLVIIAIVVVGIVLSTNGFGGVPYVTISLAVLFAVYAAIKKSLPIDSIVSTTMEIVMMAPLALLFILFFRLGNNGLAAVDGVEHLLLVGSGILTAVPMLFYAVGVRNLPMMTAGICQYLSPTIGIFCSMIMGEMLTREKLISFCFIWTGVVLYVLNMAYDQRRKKLV
ncbi:MAG: EamA family transporter RarD [Ruminococcaceae bacterium]|nr:EamA family transporter RarD [Oscillospiraceae bacterium]